MSINIHKLNQTGDTIIEVLISIAIVGMVIGLSFGTANKSIKTGRAAQEQTEALALAQAQIERIKVQAATTATWKTMVTSAFVANFCLMPNVAAGTFNIVNSAPAASTCRKIGAGNLYDVSISYAAGVAGGATDTFTAKTTWTNVKNVASSESIAYRVHAP